jgi:hypothetical protein
MKTRPTPNPINYKRPLPEKLAHDPQVLKWAKRLAGNRSARPRDLSEEQLAWVHLEVMKRRPEFSLLDGDLYLKAMAETCPVTAAPQLERQKLAEDLELLMTQPEMKDFYETWEGRRGAAGPEPDWNTAKGLMLTMSAAGISPHLDDGYTELTGNAKLWDLVQRLAGKRIRPASYQHACKQLPKLAATGLAVEANIEMVKALAQLMPGQGIGERLMIDGMPLPAWCEQKGKGKTERQEEYRRRFCPEAGARAMTYTGNGKRDVKAGDRVEKVLFKTGKFWRGYYLVVIADQATGLPLVWIIQDASLDEAPAIVPLLSDLYRLWPDCPAKLIAGDSAWDEDPWCRLAEVDYGIHPCFRVHDTNVGLQNVLGFSRDRKIAARTPFGQLVCTAHGTALDFVGSEGPGRDRLRPGQSVKDEGAFRVRGQCLDGCGTLSLRMKADWRTVTHFPHFSAGKVGGARHAYRQAMLTRLNGVEGIFDRLQTGRAIGGRDADRTRVRDKGAHEMLVSLALMTMTAATLADQRRQRGVSYPAPGSGAGPIAASPAPARPAHGGRRHGRRRGGGGGGAGKAVAAVDRPAEIFAALEVLVDV